MLTLDQIITLQEKGFSYEQLLTLNSMNVTVELIPEPEKKSEPEPEKKSEPEPEKKSEPEPEKKPEQGADAIDGLKSEITALTETIKAMQEQNVKSAQQEKKEELTADSIIASFMTAS